MTTYYHQVISHGFSLDASRQAETGTQTAKILNEPSKNSNCAYTPLFTSPGRGLAGALDVGLHVCGNDLPSVVGEEYTYNISKLVEHSKNLLKMRTT